MNDTLNSPELRVDSSSPDASDAALVSRVQRGDRRAFDLLVIRYQARVSAVVSRYVNENGEVADIVQEAFVKAWKSIDRFRGDSAFYTWLYRIAVNCAINLLNSSSYRSLRQSSELNESGNLPARLINIEDPESQLESRQTRASLQTALSRLPDELRQALLLREYDGLSYDDIATVLDCPVGTVRSRIFRAREHLMQAVEEVC